MMLILGWSRSKHLTGKKVMIIDGNNANVVLMMNISTSTELTVISMLLPGA